MLLLLLAIIYRPDQQQQQQQIPKSSSFNHFQQTYKHMQRLYISTARQLKRIESITKSPVYSHFSETLSGVGTIRAYSCMEQFITKNDDNSDINNSCNLAMFISNRWLSIRLEFIANFMVFFAAVFSIIYRQKMDSSSVGLILTYALNTIQNLNYLVRSTTDIETKLVSDVSGDIF